MSLSYFGIWQTELGSWKSNWKKSVLWIKTNAVCFQFVKILSNSERKKQNCSMRQCLVFLLDFMSSSRLFSYLPDAEVEAKMTVALPDVVRLQKEV